MLGLGKLSLNLVYFCFFHDAWKDCNVPRFRFFGLVIHLRERKRNVDWPDSRLKQDRLQTAERGTPEFAREPLSFAVLHDLTTKPWRNASHGFQPIHHQKPTNVSTAIICNNRPSIFWWFVAAIYGKKNGWCILLLSTKSSPSWSHGTELVERRSSYLFELLCCGQVWAGHEPRTWPFTIEKQLTSLRLNQGVPFHH